MVTWGICGCYRHYNISLSRDTFVWSLLFHQFIHFQQPSRSECCTGVPNITTQKKTIYTVQAATASQKLTIFFMEKLIQISLPNLLHAGFKQRCSWLLWLAQGPTDDRDWTRQCKHTRRREFLKANASSPFSQFTHQSLGCARLFKPSRQARF